MTIDHERFEALRLAGIFLNGLSLSRDPFTSKPLRLPKDVREYARKILRHYPDEWWIKELEQLRTLPGSELR